MTRQDPLTAILTYLVIALILLSTIIVIALLFVQDFDQVAPTLIAAILGPLTTAISILGGVLGARGLQSAKEEEIQKRNEEGGQTK